MKQEAEDESNLLSFLDVIACAFGAVVLLVLMIPIGIRDEIPAPPASEADYEEFRSRTEQIDTLRREYQAAEAAANQAEARLASANALAEESTDSKPLTEDRLVGLESQVARLIAENLAVAAQIETLPESTVEGPDTPGSAAQQRLANESYGIPADADYVVFVIDASGSMQSIASAVSRTLTRVLDLYPQ
ncbi:MAG: hypothetical protein ACKOZX_10050, partial [Gammaproteobacteria bacterium]